MTLTQKEKILTGFIVVLVSIIIGLSIGLLMSPAGVSNNKTDNCGGEIAAVSNIASANKNTIDYKKLCYYLLASEFQKDNSVSAADKTVLKTYTEKNYGTDLDLYFIRDAYIPLIKEFTTETKMSYTKFKDFEDIILEGIKQKEKRK